MSGEIILPINATDADAPSEGRLKIFAKEDGLYIRRPEDPVGIRLRLGANDSAASQLKNNSGRTLVYGEVVILDVNEDLSVTLAAVEGDYRVAGVVNSTSIPNGQVGAIMTQAGQVVDVLCDANPVSRGQFLILSASEGRAKASGYWKIENSFAVALSNKAGGSEGLVQALLVHAQKTIVAGRAGWSVGGNTGSTTNNAQKIVFANETWNSVSGAALPVGLFGNAGLGYGIVAGYSIGGHDGSSNYASAYKILLANEQAYSVAGANLATARRQLRYGHNGSNKGWVVGGFMVSAVSTTDKITFSSDTRSAGANLSIADTFRCGVSDGTQIFTAGSAQPTNRILIGSETIAAFSTANLPSVSNEFSAVAFPSSAGYYIYGLNAAKISFASGIATSGLGPSANHRQASGVGDGITVGYVAGDNVAPIDVAERFNPATETFSAANSMAIGKYAAAVFSVGAF